MNITDTIIVYYIAKKLIKPFEEWDAYKLGIIDKDGNKIKEPKTFEEKKAWSLLDRLICKLKKIIEKFLGKSRLSMYLSLSYLLKDCLDENNKEKILCEFKLEEYEKILKINNILNLMNFTIEEKINIFNEEEVKNFILSGNISEKNQLNKYIYKKIEKIFYE